ncbi:MAG: LexA family transcriptional regulator [Polaribacter sp.]
MMNKSNILNSIKKHLNINTDKDFAEFLEIKPTTLSMWHKRNTMDIELLFNKCELLNAEWLLTGQGEMLKTEMVVNKPSAIYKLKTDNIKDNQSVPLYNLEASAGLVSLFSSHNDQTPIDYIQIPNLPKCDGALTVTGDSMYPLLKSGDIIMYKELSNEIANILFGEMYLISLDLDGDEYVSVKWIQRSDKGEKYIKLVSENQHHQPKDVALKKVRALALVKASVRINAMR